MTPPLPALARRSLLSGAALLATQAATAFGQAPVSPQFTQRINEANAGTVGVIAGGVDGTYIRIAADLAAVLDNGNALRVVAMIGRGSLQNIQDIVLLRGVDVGIVQSDALAFARRNRLVPGADNLIQYIAKLYDEEIHLLARPGIHTMQDLAGQLVNVDLVGSGTAMTASLMFEALGLELRTAHDVQDVALNDTIDGGAGNDTLDGGTGIDTVSYASATAGVTVSLALSSSQTTGGAGTDTLISIENLTGSGFNDGLTGSNGDNVLTGGVGNDTLDGRDGTDTASFSGALANYRFAFDGSVFVLSGPDGTDRLSNIEAVTFGSGNSVSISSLIGSGVIEEVMSVQTGGITTKVIPSMYSGPVSWIKYEMLGNTASDVIVGTSKNDFINLMGGDDAANGGAGDDVLDGGTGSNFLSGGAGRDDFFLDGRGGTTTWATITDWSAGERLSVWGWRPGVSKVQWVDSAGAPGWTGVTMHGDLDGNGVIDTSVTWTGQNRSQLPTPLEFDGLLWFT